MPFELLPDELLSEMFRHYVGLHGPPWRLTLVSKRWHHVALKTPAIWTHITITDDQHDLVDYRDFLGAINHSYGRALLCRNVEELTKATTRAGILPLHITLVIDYETISVDLLAEVFSIEMTRRTSDLIIWVRGDLDKTIDLIPHFNPFTRLEMLHMASIPSQWMVALLNSIYISSPISVRSLELPRNSKVTDEQLNEALHQFSNLEYLRGTISWPNGQTQDLSLPHLKRLDLNCLPYYIRRLSLPKLQSLTLWAQKGPMGSLEAIGPLEFPLLVELQFHAQNTRWLEQIITPRLRSLSIRGIIHHRPAQWKFHSLRSRSFPTVKNLHFETHTFRGDGDTQDLLLIAALEAVPNVSSVLLSTGSSSSVDPKMRLQLLDRLGSTDKDDFLCPELRDLELISYNPRSSEVAEYEIYLLEGIVNSRREMGQGLKRFVVQWKNQAGETIKRRYV